MRAKARTEEALVINGNPVLESPMARGRGTMTQAIQAVIGVVVRGGVRRPSGPEGRTHESPNHCV